MSDSGGCLIPLTFMLFRSDHYNGVKGNINRSSKDLKGATYSQGSASSHPSARMKTVGSVSKEEVWKL